MTGGGRRRHADALDCIEDDEAQDERGELRVAGLAKLVGVGFEQKVPDVTPGDG